MREQQWVNFKGATFDLSRVTHFTYGNAYVVGKKVPVEGKSSMNAILENGGSIFLGNVENNRIREAVDDIIKGKYNIIKKEV